MKTMEFKGTKGEWSKMIGGFSKKGGEPNMIQIYSANNELELVCKVYKDNQLMTNQDFESNAKLIAAAPDLLAILIRIKEEHGLGEKELEDEMNQAIEKALK